MSDTLNFSLPENSFAQYILEPGINVHLYHGDPPNDGLNINLTDLPLGPVGIEVVPDKDSYRTFINFSGEGERVIRDLTNGKNGKRRRYAGHTDDYILVAVDGAYEITWKTDCGLKELDREITVMIELDRHHNKIGVSYTTIQKQPRSGFWKWLLG